MEDIWLYEVLGISWGIVKADTEEEAEQKVREAYKKHSINFDEYIPIIIRPKTESNWFADCPDVLEVYY